MPSHEEHCRESVKKYGKDYSWLHRWMDEPSTMYHKGHRRARHDEETLEYIRRKWGFEAYQVALDHVRLDGLSIKIDVNEARQTVEQARQEMLNKLEEMRRTVKSADKGTQIDRDMIDIIDGYIERISKAQSVDGCIEEAKRFLNMLEEAIKEVRKRSGEPYF